MLKEVNNLTPHITSAKRTNALFCGNHNLNTLGKLMAAEPKRLARQAFRFIPNSCSACACSKSQPELLFFS